MTRDVQGWERCRCALPHKPDLVLKNSSSKIEPSFSRCPAHTTTTADNACWKVLRLLTATTWSLTMVTACDSTRYHRELSSPDWVDPVGRLQQQSILNEWYRGQFLDTVFFPFHQTLSLELDPEEVVIRNLFIPTDFEDYAWSIDCWRKITLICWLKVPLSSPYSFYFVGQFWLYLATV